ncbi:twin-arginine translocase subunit TatB [Deltaproteobacteria bacterium Smac51]|nr:twin-arginine translocase subunit TatB [Deltaproteobacteria bacterium Smac51]
MFGIGWGEMVVIGLVALVVVGPEKLPELARTVGKIYGQLRQAAAEAGQDFSEEVEMLKSGGLANPVEEARQTHSARPIETAEAPEHQSLGPNGRTENDKDERTNEQV